MAFDFLPKGRKKKIPYKDRVAQLLEIVNKKGRVSITELSGLWMVEYAYALRLARIALARHSHIKYDELMDEIVIPERVETKQPTPGTSKEEGVKG